MKCVIGSITRLSVILRLMVALLLVVLGITPVLAFDWFPIDSGPRNLAMGGAWLASGRGSQVIVGNPALLGLHTRSRISLNLINTHDKVDAVDLITGERDHRKSDPFISFHGGGAVGILQMREGYHGVPAPAIHVQRQVGPGYASGQEDGTGGPVAYNLGFGYQSRIGFALGAGYSMVTGSYRGDDAEKATFYTALRIYFGAAIPFERFGFPFPVTLGLTLQPAYTYEGVNDSYRYPMSYDMPLTYGIGLAVEPFRWLLLSCDARYFMAEGKTYQPGGLSGDTRYPLTSRDETEVELRGGMEVGIPVGEATWFLRGGVSWLPTLVDLHKENLVYLELKGRRPRHETCWSYGVGVATSQFEVDVAIYQRTQDVEVWITPTPIWFPGSEAMHGKGSAESFVIQMGLTLFFTPPKQPGEDA